MCLNPPCEELLQWERLLTILELTSVTLSLQWQLLLEMRSPMLSSSASHFVSYHTLRASVQQPGWVHGRRYRRDARSVYGGGPARIVPLANSAQQQNHTTLFSNSLGSIQPSSPSTPQQRVVLRRLLRRLRPVHQGPRDRPPRDRRRPRT